MLSSVKLTWNDFNCVVFEIRSLEVLFGYSVNLSIFPLMDLSVDDTNMYGD